MIGIDASIIAAILIFLAVVGTLNVVLLRPLQRVLAERAAKTVGVMESSHRDVDYSIELFNQYQAAIKNARSEGYRLMEQTRAAALERRAELLRGARVQAEDMIEEARKTIARQVAESKEQLGRDIEEIARGIAASVLGRTA
ncbi:MAG: ATP synthase F0 subunit B [Acidobacteria bacterium]|nr:ATP synthase F0 subunit B [Acidobacteriota bacterium]